MGLAYQIKLSPPIGRTCDLKPGDPVTIGTGDGVKVLLSGTDPQHCRIEVTVRGVEVFNQSKVAGTYVNGRKVERSLLKDGDELRVGSVPAVKVTIKATETPDAGFGPGAAQPAGTSSGPVVVVGAPPSEAGDGAAGARQPSGTASGSVSVGAAGKPGGAPGARGTQTFSKETLKAHAQAQSLAQAVAQAQAEKPTAGASASGAITAPPALKAPGTGTGRTTQSFSKEGVADAVAQKGAPFFGVAPTNVAHPIPTPPPPGSGLAQTLSPGQFSPKAPPPLTRKFDPTLVPGAQSPPGANASGSLGPVGVTSGPAPAGGSLTQVFGVGGKPFRMSAADEHAGKPVMRERDGSALLGQQNNATPVELTRRAFFGGVKPEEKPYAPAPAFEPEQFDANASTFAAKAGAPAPLDASLTAESQEERLVRTELEGSGLAVMARLGGSASVTVYRARRRDLGQEVVVKAVRVEQGDPEGRAARLLAEAKVAAKLHHPGIVQVHGVFRGKSFVAIVLESLHGISLTDEVAARGRLTTREGAALGERLGRALSHAHAQGVVHRDVAPRNVMLTQQGELKLLGFGFAASLDHERGGGIVSSTEAKGTPGFVAPEQAANPAAVDRRADVYGLGATIFFALSGKSPDSALGMEGTAAIGRELTGPIARVIAKALRANPADRYDTVDALLTGLREAAAVTAETGSLRKGIITEMIQAGQSPGHSPAPHEPLGFRGRLSGREVVGLLRGVDAGKKTGWLEVRGAAPDGSEVVGAVYFRDGEFVRSAVSGRRTAADALLEVALLPIADFAFVYAPLESLGDEERVGVTVTLQAVAEKLTGRSR